MVTIYLKAAQQCVNRGWYIEARMMLRHALKFANQDGSERSNLMRAMNYVRLLGRG